EIVAALEPDLLADIIARMAGMGTTSPEFIREAEQVLEREVMSRGYGEQQSTGGVDEIVQIINSLDRASEKSILEQLAVKNPSLADEIRAKLFVFEDIAKLDSRSIQRVLKEVPNADLAAALKLATDEVRDKILGNMTKRLQAMIQDEIEVMGQMRIRDVEEAQQRVVAIVRRLEEEGEIDIARGDGDVFV
ncbi:MAG: flagellar motor switch protein FliG, partial [Oscillospiraceae bacterium]|nr:flagellar motor switch protein FliG [Oscillospiraceae bacterium]